MPDRWGAEAFAAAEWLEEVSIEAGEARARVRPHVLEMLSEGHFPGEPLVPGSHLLAVASLLAGELLRREEGHAPRLRRLERCRFRAPVRPGQAVTVAARVQATARGREVLAEVSVEGQVAAQARLSYGEAP